MPKYKATRKFKSNGKHYEPGDEWTPSGGKFDKKIIGRLVIEVEDEPQPKARSKRDTGSK